MSEELTEYLVREGLVGDHQAGLNPISALDVTSIIKRESEVTQRENDLFKSVGCIFLAILISYFIIAI